MGAMNDFDLVVEQVRRLKPGQSVHVSRGLLRSAPCMPPFTPADWVLENIVGSAFGYSHRFDPDTGNVVFHRDSSLERRTYTSPDRR